MQQETGDQGIYKKLWKTKGIRYGAYHRLKDQARWSIITISILSFYILALSIVAILFQSNFTPFHHQLFNAFSLISSVFIMIVTFVESLKSYDLQADALHRNANEISKLFNEFQRRSRDKKVDEGYSQTVIEKYNHLLDSCPYNHGEIDYERFKVKEPNEFNLVGWRLVTVRPYLLFKVWLLSYGAFLGLLIGLPTLFYLMLKFCKLIN